MDRTNTFYNEQAWDREVDKNIWTDGLTEGAAKGIVGNNRNPSYHVQADALLVDWRPEANEFLPSVPAAVNKRFCSPWRAARSRLSIFQANSLNRIEKSPNSWA